MKLLSSFIGLILCFSSLVFGSTEIKGEYSGFLKLENSPYIITETLVVTEGHALVIESGVVLKFKPHTGIDIQGGSLAIVGDNQKRVLMESLSENESWNGISITGLHKALLQDVDILNAKNGIAIENGSMELKNVNIEDTKNIALYVKSSLVDIQWSNFKLNNGVSLWLSDDAFLNMNSCEFFKNNIGIFLENNSKFQIQNSKISHNNYGVVNKGGKEISFIKTQIEQNLVGFVSKDVPEDNVKKMMKNNQKNLEQNFNQIDITFFDEPNNPFADEFRMPLLKVNEKNNEIVWNKSGKIEFLLGYHHIMMHKNHTGESYIVGSDTVNVGDRYVNYFQIPGLFGELNTYLLMESNDGKNLEVNANLYANSWNHLELPNISVIYSDNMQKLSMGDIYLSLGNIYMSGVQFLGGAYDLNLFKNDNDKPLFVASIFGGEVEKPKVLGERNEDVYKDYIEDGEIEPQKLMVGGKIRWNMHRRFNGTLGFVGSKDYLENPLLRDGSPENSNTISPMITSKTFFADGNWLFFPGDIELNGQIAIGSADTANATLQRAINEVFVSAGVDVSDMATIRKLMNNETLVDKMTFEELENFFGDNTMKSKVELQKKLKSLLQIAKKMKKDFDSEDATKEKIKNWDGQNISFTGSMRFDMGKTLIFGYVRFVGRDYYSVGSPDLLQNSREVFGSIEQQFFDFWQLNFNYKINVENASHGNAYNIFGLAEGEKLGLIPGASSKFLREHEQDENRTLYEHDVHLNNEFKINKTFELSLGYNMNYRTRWTDNRLFLDYSLESGIFEDSWFIPIEGQKTIKVERENDTLELDSLRFLSYYELRKEPYLATQFDERIIKHILKLGLKINLSKNMINLMSIFTIRNDLSIFEQDDLLQDFDFSDESYGLLGYYFHGGDYIEGKFPTSITSNFGLFRNMFTFTPRYKIYNRDNMTDFEWSILDNMSIPLSKNFLDLLLAFSIRQDFLNRDEDVEKITEKETDLFGSVSLHFMYTKNLVANFTLGSYAYYRSVYKSDEYKDLFLSADISYTF